MGRLVGLPVIIKKARIFNLHRSYRVTCSHINSNDHRDLKVSQKIYVYFDSARRQGFYFDCVQLAIGGQGHVTQHMRGSTVHNQNKNKSRKSETNTELSKSRWCIARKMVFNQGSTIKYSNNITQI